ncbi:MAG: protein-disulfide reductase DsbD domain-containing protein [Paracoccaceae bacterium]|jgi:DsbC/DsbD-like thiol-disulfide interchange protein|nr:protein-disulfide reductase DsbD domain-containing protein [Paracoccaceae bacterium]
MKRAPHAPSPLTLALCAALAAGLSAAAQAQTDNPADMVQARILPGWSGTDGGHMAALQLTLSPGWKTYWRAPGDAGIPPAMNFQGSHNLASVTPVWPTPEVFLQNGMQTVGYDGQLVLPLRIMPQDSTRPARVAGRLQIGICSTICVPVDLDFALDLPASGSDPQQAMIRAALADQPISAAKASVGDVDCTLSPISDGLGLTVEIDMPSAGGTETVLIETSDPLVWVAETESTRQGGTLTATTELVHVSGQAFALDRSGLRMTVLGTDRAVDIQGCTAD